MEKIFIFYGYNKEFSKYIPDTYYPLDTLVEISDIQKKTVIPVGSKLDYVVGFTMSYSGITEGGIQNFVSILDSQRDSLKAVYLQNPPDCIVEEILRQYPNDIIQIKYHKYQKINKNKISEFIKNFDKLIIGQQNVKIQVASILYELYKKRNKSKPIVFMFYGPSGVGKTETAKYLGKLLGGELCRFQMSMYQTNGFYEFLYGSDHNKGSFAKELLERESNVILFDEFDKAHPGIWSAFYQLFDEGIYKDRNYTVDLRNTIVICTSNEHSPDNIRGAIGDPLFFRINAYVEFGKLSNESKKKICKNIFEDEYRKLSKLEKEIIVHDLFLDKYLKISNQLENYRQMKNIICNDISKVLVEKLFL